MKTLQFVVRIGTALSVLACLGTAVSAQTAPVAKSDATGISPVKMASWHSWKWAGDHDAIMIPIRFEGLKGEFLMQLDTGSNGSMVYGKTFLPLAAKAGLKLRKGGNSVYIRQSFTIGDRDFKDFPIYVNEDMGEQKQDLSKPVLIGTIGLDLFTDNAWALDFVNDRFALTPYWDDLPDGVGNQGLQVQTTLRNAKLFLPLKIDGQNNEDFFYDSGSSGAGLFTSATMWRKLTGRTGEEKDNTRIEGYSWGKKITITGATGTAKIELGELTFDKPAIMTNFQPPPNHDFEHYPFRAAGVIGNQPFLGKGTLIIDIRRSLVSFIPLKKKETGKKTDK